MKSPTTLHAIPVVILAALAGIPATAVAQGTAADYARADALRARYESAAVDIAEPASAIGRTHRFWYRKAIKGGEEFMTIDADMQQKRPAFDHASIAHALSEATGHPYSALKLPFNTLAFFPTTARRSW